MDLFGVSVTRERLNTRACVILLLRSGEVESFGLFGAEMLLCKLLVRVIFMFAVFTAAPKATSLHRGFSENLLF